MDYEQVEEAPGTTASDYPAVGQAMAVEKN
jgi:hypothetical protein